MIIIIIIQKKSDYVKRFIPEDDIPLPVPLLGARNTLTFANSYYKIDNENHYQ
jgi:hypothetical protein